MVNDEVLNTKVIDDITVRDLIDCFCLALDGVNYPNEGNLDGLPEGDGDKILSTRDKLIETWLKKIL